MHIQEAGSFSHEIDLYTRSPQGFRAETWWNDWYVVQQRDLANWPRWQAATKILESIPRDPDDILLGARHRWELDDQSFWVQFPRFDLQGSPSRSHDLSPEERVEIFGEVLPDVLQTSDFLAKQKPGARSISALENCKPLAKEAVSRYSEYAVRSYAEALGLRSEIPFPEPGSWVLQHGDYSLGNIILSAKGYRMIDWENLCTNEYGSDLAHLFTFVLLPSPPKQWRQITDTFSQQIASSLDISESNWRRRVYWEMLREFLYWQQGEDIHQKADWALQVV